MEQLPERVPSRLGEAGPERDGAQLDEASSSEPHQSGSKQSSFSEPEKENLKDRLRAQGLRRQTEEAPGSSSHQRNNIIRSHYNEDIKAFEPKSPDGSLFEELQDSMQHCEPQADSDSLLVYTSTSESDSDDTRRTIAPHLVSHLIPKQIGQMYLDTKRNVWLRQDGLHESQDAEDDPFAGIADLAVDEIKEREMQNLRPGEQIQNPKLAGWEDKGEVKSTKNSPQLMGLDKHGLTKEVEEARQLPAHDPIKKRQKKRGKTKAPRPPKPDVGDVLEAVHTFTARSSDELTLAKGDEVVVIEKDDEFGDGWFLGKLLSNGVCGLFPEVYTHVKIPRAFAKLEYRPTAQTGAYELKLDATRSQPGKHTHQGYEDVTGVGEPNSDEPPSRTMTPLLPPLYSPFPPPGSPRRSNDADDEDVPPLFSASRHPRLRPRSYDHNEAKEEEEKEKEADDYNNDNDNDGDNKSEDEVVVVEEHSPPASVYTGTDGGAGTSVEDVDSHAVYSSIFSEKSREQPTDPSSWIDSLSADQATFGVKKEEINVNHEVEDCSRSISSVADSIGSAVSTGGSLGQAGVNYVVAKFTQSDPELLALYTEASQRLTKIRFVDNNRRLLKMFYLDFTREEQSPSQREAVAFLRSRRRRAEISLDIFRTVTPDYEVIDSTETHRKEFSMLNAYFETLDAADRDKNVEEDQKSSGSNGSEVGGGVGQPSLDMTNLQAIGEYFVTSRAFSQYKQRLRQFLHPNDGTKHGSAEVQGAYHSGEEHLIDASRAVEPGAMPSTDTDTGHFLDNQREGTTIQAEEWLAEHRADHTRNESRSEGTQEPFPGSSQIEGLHMPWERDVFTTWVAKWVTDTFWPPSQGSQRIWYLCGCGQHTYMDVKELEPGGVESEWRSISESSAAARRAHSSQSSAHSGGHILSTPSPVHLSSTSPRDTASSNSLSQDTPYTPRSYANPASAISPGPPGTARRDPMFLLICINGQTYKTLAELRCLDIDDSCNDELLIRGILNQYEEARKGCQWTVNLLLPTWMLPAILVQHLKKIWERVPLSVRIPSIIRESLLAQHVSGWWNCWAPDVSLWAPLHIIDTADFVEFELVPHPEGKEAFPSHFTPGCWPAPDNKQYRYRPVPMRCVKTMNLWHMRRPGPHTEAYWYNTVPKKVDGALYRPSGTVEDVIGYGVRINERLNDVLVLWWSFIFILATGLFVYVYSRCTSDNSSAFGLGAYLLAAFTVYIQLQYAWWKRA